MSRKLRFLITGFGPFPGAPYNPTPPLVARLLRLRRPALADVELFGHIFTVTYKTVDRELPEILAKLRPDALLMFGLADRTAYMRVETRARNSITTLWPDADADPIAQGLDRRGQRRQDVRPAYRKAVARGASDRDRRARLTRCRQLSLQLFELARDRGGKQG